MVQRLAFLAFGSLFCNWDGELRDKRTQLAQTIEAETIVCEGLSTVGSLLVSWEKVEKEGPAITAGTLRRFILVFDAQSL